MNTIQHLVVVAYHSCVCLRRCQAVRTHATDLRVMGAEMSSRRHGTSSRFHLLMVRCMKAGRPHGSYCRKPAWGHRQAATGRQAGRQAGQAGGAGGRGTSTKRPGLTHAYAPCTRTWRGSMSNNARSEGGGGLFVSTCPLPPVTAAKKQSSQQGIHARQGYVALGGASIHNCHTE